MCCRHYVHPLVFRAEPNLPPYNTWIWAGAVRKRTYDQTHRFGLSLPVVRS